MIYFANAIIDVGNAIMVFLPLLCWALALMFGCLWLSYLQQAGSPATYDRGDKVRAWGYLFLAGACLSFPTLVNAINVTFGLPARAVMGGGLVPFLTQLPNLAYTTPSEFFLAMIGVFRPGFYAFGAAFIFRIVWVLKDAGKHGLNVAGPVCGYAIAGVVFLNIETFAAMGVNMWGGAGA